MLSTFNRNGRRIRLSDRTICNSILIAAGFGFTIGFLLVMFALDALARWGAANPLIAFPVIATVFVAFRFGGKR
ncbi:hypothetical protein UFOVP209_48 [uncultured Caudovirales phage]|uniref:Uncharacterized protein n=1 Tax=uncultured Caudovirales phage TaxID=2100421 RepID=A0A6J7WMP2_9CAUD|nr:hypothetical protein UFOVP209_48 [uncultured Caudovirales phage]